MTDERKIVLTYILEDDRATSEMIVEILKNNSIVDYRIFSNSSEFLSSLTHEVKICVIDYMLSEKLTGLDVMKIVLAKVPECFVIIVTGQQSHDVAVDFLNYGAWKYVKKSNPKYLNELVDYILLAIKEIEKNEMLADISGKMTAMQNRSNERRTGKQDH